MTGPEEPPAVYSLLTLDFCVVLVTLHWQQTANPWASGSPLGTSSHEQWKLLSFVPCEFLAPKIVLLTSKGQHMSVKCVVVHSWRVRDFYVKNLRVCTVTGGEHCSLPSCFHFEGTTQNIICFLEHRREVVVKVLCVRGPGMKKDRQSFPTRDQSFLAATLWHAGQLKHSTRD